MGYFPDARKAGVEVLFLTCRVKPDELVINYNDKNLELFLQQKDTLDKFLARGAISQSQYDKSYGDLVMKMGMEEIAKELAEKKE